MCISDLYVGRGIRPNAVNVNLMTNSPYKNLNNDFQSIFAMGVEVTLAGSYSPNGTSTQ